jgi:hypothetical protein
MKAWAVSTMLGLGVSLTLIAPETSDAKNRYALEPPSVETKPAYQYAAMGDDDCLASLRQRRVPFQEVGATGQIARPLRLTGPVRGVAFKLSPRPEPVGLDPDLGTSSPPEMRSPASIADCRLLLAVDDLAQVLKRHNVIEVEYLSMFRQKGVGWVKKGKRHPSGRAIDVSALKLRDGRSISVAFDWHGRVGQKTCGIGAAKPTKDTEEARLLRDIVCELDDQGAFNLVLTPHYDWGHRDHFHLEVRSDVRWFLVQ